MARRLILKGIVALTLVCMGIVALTVIIVFGYFFLALAFPRRMNVTGRVIDSGGKPIKGIEVRAVPLPIHDPYVEHEIKPKDKEHITITDENGCFSFKRLIASGGVKEGMWLQEYNIVVTAEGYRPQTIRVRNYFEKHQDVIILGDFILEEKGSDEKEDSQLVGLFKEVSKTKK